MSDLPTRLPGREPDDALDLLSLAAVRDRIVAHVDSTQGAFLRRGVFARAWPLLLAVCCALMTLAWGLNKGHAVTPSAVVAVCAMVVALAAVWRAPTHPASSERIASAALLLACAAIGVELATVRSSAGPAGSDVACTSAITLLALPAVLCCAWFLRRGFVPARSLHVVSVVAAGFLASAAAVWTECPGTALGHLVRAHAVLPTMLAALVWCVAAWLIRRPTVSLNSTSSSSV